METMKHYPFIYFLYERNQVLVYKIQTLDYITLANVVEKGEWEGYELLPSEPFTTFRHEQSYPKEGWSFWVAAEHLSHLVDTIHDYIQLQRKSMMTTTAQVVHIVCSELQQAPYEWHLLRLNMSLAFQRICLSDRCGSLMKKEDKHAAKSG